MYSRPSTSMVVLMAQSCLRRSGSRLILRCLLRLDFLYEPELRYSFSCAVYGIMCLDCSSVFYYFISCGSKSALLSVHDWYAVVLMAPLVTGPSGITSPHGTVNRTRTCSALSSHRTRPMCVCVLRFTMTVRVV